jgi:hypothetical protein
VFELEVDTSNGEDKIRRPQPDGASQKAADLFFTISSFYLNCGRIESLPSLIGSASIA